MGFRAKKGNIEFQSSQNFLTFPDFDWISQSFKHYDMPITQVKLKGTLEYVNGKGYT